MAASPPEWIPLTVAAVGVAGAFATAAVGQIWTRRREDARWQREREAEQSRWQREADAREAQWEREDVARWLNEHRHLYAEFLQASEAALADLVQAFEEVTSNAANSEVGVDATPASATSVSDVEQWQIKREHALQQIMLIAPRGIASEAHGLSGDLGFLLAALTELRTGCRFETVLGVEYASVDDLGNLVQVNIRRAELRIGALRDDMRISLGVGNLDEEKNYKLPNISSDYQNPL